MYCFSLKESEEVRAESFFHLRDVVMSSIMFENDDSVISLMNNTRSLLAYSDQMLLFYISSLPPSDRSCLYKCKV